MNRSEAYVDEGIMLDILRTLEEIRDQGDDEPDCWVCNGVGTTGLPDDVRECLRCKGE